MRNVLVRTLVVVAAAATVGFMAATTAHADPAASSQVGVEQTKLSHADATARLRGAGITWSSSGGCSDRNNPTCTSLEQVNLATIQGAITLRGASGCALNVTGGTETGHASGTYSHWNGYKLDFSLSSCIRGYVDANFSYIGGSKWQSGSGNIYFLESNHWDVLYYNCGGC